MSFKTPENGFGVHDTGATSIQIVLFALGTHALLRAISFREENPTVPADET